MPRMLCNVVQFREWEFDGTHSSGQALRRFYTLLFFLLAGRCVEIGKRLSKTIDSPTIVDH